MKTSIKQQTNNYKVASNINTEKRS